MDPFGSFNSTKASLFGLLKEIQDAKIQLPDFQRGWVWDDEHVRSLLASISLAFPIGAVMMLETGNPKVRFKPRPVQGVSASDPRTPDKLILDGQQRLTSLYQALVMDAPVATRDAKKAEISRYYYIDLAKALDPAMDREEAVFGVPPDRMLKNFRAEVILDLSTTEKECEHGALPVSLLFDIAALTRWQMAYLRTNPDAAEDRLDRWSHVVARIVQPFQQYQIPLILLGKETSKEAVCKVFEKVNTGGVSLTVFELLTATYAADDYSLRDDWAVRSDRLRKTAGVLQNVESTDFLQTITLLSTLDRRRRNPTAAVGCKRKDILELERDEYERLAEPVTEGYERAARFLYQEKFFAARDVPYRTQLIPLAAILAELGSKADHEGVVAKIRRWYWCGVLGELYGGTIESRFGKDVPQVLEWIDGGAEPDTVTEANFLPLRLRTLRTRLSAAYKGIHALLMSGGAQDFRSGRPIDSQIYFDDRIDIHHIFPIAWCAKKKDIPAGLPDSIVNKTPISAASNKAIGGAPPSQYLNRIQQRSGISEERIHEILRTHFIAPDAMRSDDFWAFFRAREEALIDLIERATGKPVAGAAAPSVDPGADLEEVETREGFAPRIPRDAMGVLVVEGETDEQYLRLSAEIAGRPHLLQGIHIVACKGVNGVVRQSVQIQSNSDRPVIAIFDRDEPGKSGRDTLMKRFNFTKHQVMTYAEVLDASADDVEAEDLFPRNLLERFMEEFGEENVLSEKRMHPQLKMWHYGFNATGKEIIAQYLREHATEVDVANWVKLLEVLRTRLGLPTAAPSVPSSRVYRERSQEDIADEADEGSLTSPAEFISTEDDLEGEDEGFSEEVDDEPGLPSMDLDALLKELRARVRAVATEITEVERSRYIAFSRGRRFLAVVPQRGSLRLNLALGADYEDPLGMVRRRAFADEHPESVWAYQARLADGTMLDPAMELIRQAFENVVSKTGDRPWLVDGKAWHLEEKCHPRGRAIVESLMRLIEEAAPGAEGPDWGQKHYIAWTRNGRVWVRVGTRANQAALFIYGSSQTPEAIAAELGYELFEREAEQSDKLALGSSVVGAKDGSGVRIIVKHSRDLGERQSDVIRSLLRDSWARTQGQ